MDRIEAKLDFLMELVRKFQPMLDRYEAAAVAGSFRKSYKAMKGN